MIGYSEDWLLATLFQCRGSVFPRACWFAVPATLIAVFLVCSDDWIGPEFREELGINTADKSQLWIISVGVLHGLLLFRTSRAMARFWEGTGLLHQMRGEWFDAVSCCVTFSRTCMLNSARRDDTLKFRHTLIRLMSLCHGSALMEIGGSEADDELEMLDAVGLDNKTLLHLKDCSEVYEFNRVEVTLHMIQSLITANLDDGILKIPPPILSRVYQTLSRGFVNFLNAKKIADTRFPFPFAQLISCLTFVHIFLTPIMISSIFTTAPMTAIFTFIPIFGMCCLNFIGVELENPFGKDPNDLPLELFQAEMNNCLLMLLHSSADLMAGIEPKRCLWDVQRILANMQMDLHSNDGEQKKDRPRITSFQDQVESILDQELEDDGAMRETPSIETKKKDSAVSSSTPSAVAPSSGGGQEARPAPPVVEEKLQTATLLQGMEQMVNVLTEIKKAVEKQSSDVKQSMDCFKDLTGNLEALVADSEQISALGRREAPMPRLIQGCNKSLMPKVASCDCSGSPR